MTTPRGSVATSERLAIHRGRQQLTDITVGPEAVPTAEAPPPAEGVDLSPVLDLLDHSLTRYTWWSNTQELVTFTTSAAVKSLPDVVVAGIPGGAIVQKVIAVFKFREVSDSSSVLNDMNGAFAIQNRLSGGSFVTAINGVDQQFQVPADERGPGDVLIGDNDRVADIFADGTYNFQFASIASTGSNLLLRDVQCGLIITWL